MRAWTVLLLALSIAFAGCTTDDSEDGETMTDTETDDGMDDGTMTDTETDDSMDDGTMTDTETNTPAPETGDDPDEAGPATHSVAIRNSKFTPAEVTAKAGDTVKWKNQDDEFPHTVTSDDGRFPSSSGHVNSGFTYSHEFTSAGTYAYHCELHGETGSIIVS